MADICNMARKKPQEKKQIKANRQFYDCMESNKRFIIHVGSTRSGKTYSIIQYLIYLGLATDPEEQLSFTLCRKWLPSVKESIYLDFMEILKEWGYYDETYHNKTDMKYELNGHTYKFMATADQPERLRSMKRDILYMNEVQEFSKEEFKQLNWRTKKQVIMDYNPSMSEHWIYDMEDNRADDIDVFHSTYHDNKFLPDAQIREIEALAKTDPEAWQVYGLGKRATIRKGRIFKGWEEVYQLPENGDVCYGIDYGYSPDPCAIVKVVKENDSFFVKELAYATKMQVEDIMQVLRNSDYRGEMIFCDHNQKQITEALRRAGYNATEAKKGSGSILEGINFMRRSTILYTADSENLKKEYNTYSWKLKRGFDPDDPNAYESVPEDKNNHLCDSLRMALFSNYFVSSTFMVV